MRPSLAASVSIPVLTAQFDRLFDSLEAVASNEDPFDEERMADILHREITSLLSMVRARYRLAR